MEQALRMVLKRPGNDICADCGGRYPRFASITLAVFLCNRCYGIHRSIGTHITRTKTVGLDRWSSDEVHRMSSIGNLVANSYWEEKAPPIFQRPNADSPDFEVEKWIRDKYERKLFCSSRKDPPSVTSQVADPVSSDASMRTKSPQVKLLPRGTLRCGPDCIAPSAPGEASSNAMSSPTPPRDDFFFQVRPPQPIQHRTNGPAEVLQQSDPAYNDDEDFGDFVQA